MKKILLSLLIAIGLGVSNNNKVEIPACSIVETKEEKQDKVTENIQTQIDDKLENYVIGVVAGEMSVSFPYEALKAQAVASRTYAVRGANGNKNFDYTKLKQNYISVDKMEKMWGKSFDENYKKISQCVNETQGEILEYNNEPILAVFCSTSNGETENCKDVWGQDLQYLTSVESTGDKYSPYYNGTVTVSAKTVKSIFGSENIAIKERTSAGYVATVSIGGKEFSGEKIRTTFHLKSCDFTITRNGSDIVFKTKGYGHGVGMSQYGAVYMANNGTKYIDILSHYYKNTNIKKI